uniref:Regulatory protein zeste n=1 Tax=Glossina palpalis gambiensis TaxID=67801 RepID=A0A1B0BHZ5_9MUSC
MWLSSLLLAYSLPKIVKEKRERQPNWTEPEKQLLLSLTRMHQSILENKSSDTMTIKRKSEAWDEIAQNMKAVGYNRSKERLKQQLGRIRAAEAKKVKEAVEKGLAPGSNIPAITNGNLPVDNRVDTSVRSCAENRLETIFDKSAVLPTPLQDELHIKVEKSPSLDEYDGECLMQEHPTPISTSVSNTVSVTSVSKSYESSVMQVMLHNLDSLSEMMEAGDMNNSSNNSSLPSVANATLDSNVRNAFAATAATIDTATTTTEKTVHLQQNQHEVRLHETNVRPATTGRQRRPYRLHFYRIAVERERLRTLKLQQRRDILVERERLRNLKLQQKRDRVLYRKDVQIQNLKLQILRNLTTQNRDNNRINF